MSGRIEVDGAKPADSWRAGDETATVASMRAELVAKIGDCCMGGDPLCAGGCLAEKAAKRNAEREAALAAQGQGEAVHWISEAVKECAADLRKHGKQVHDLPKLADDLRRMANKLEQRLGDAVLYTAPPASPAGVPDGWLPIESAPNDETPHVRGLHVFSSTDGAHLYWDAVVGRVDTEDGQFYDLGGDLSSGWAADDFTHWHALAAAPSAPESNT